MATVDSITSCCLLLPAYFFTRGECLSCRRTWHGRLVRERLGYFNRHAQDARATGFRRIIPNSNDDRKAV
jgi:hypothetical protein